MKKHIWTIVSILFAALLIGAEAMATYQVWRLNILPLRYFYIAGIILIIIGVTLSVMMFPHVGKRRSKKDKIGKAIQRVAAYILALAVAGVCFFGADALSKVKDTMDAVTENTVISDVIGVYVLADNPVAAIEETETFYFAITEAFDWENTQKAIGSLYDDTGFSVTCIRYNSVFEMIDALYSEEVDALIVNKAFLSVLEEFDAYWDFDERTKQIYEYSVTETIPIETKPADTTPVSPDENENEEESSLSNPDIKISPFVMYLSGSDTRSTVLTTSRSDVNILAVVNPETKQILLINTPRDYYVPNPVGGGSLDKLTHCGIYGIDCSMKALGNLYGVSIDYYAQINFTGFETLIDALGGVTVYSETSFTTYHGGYYIQAGNNNLNGHQAVCFARERYALASGDNARGKNQMKLITAIIEKMTAENLVSNYSEILESMKGTFATSVPQEVITNFVKMQLNDMAQWSVVSYAVTGTGASRTTYSSPNFYAYVTLPNQETVDHASDLINRVLSGEILEKDDLAR